MQDEEQQEPQDNATEDQAEGDTAQGDTPGDSQVSPEEQKMYDTFTVACLSQMYDPDAAKMIVEKLKNEGPDHLPFAIGHTAAMIALSVVRAAKQQGQDIPNDIVLEGGKEVVAELINIAERAKLVTFKDDDERAKYARAVMFEAVKAFGDGMLKSGTATPEEQAQYKQDYASMRQEAYGDQPPEQQQQPPQGGGIINGAMQQ
jgi:hypothetical protein